MSPVAGLLFAAIVLGMGIGKFILPSLAALGVSLVIGLALGVLSAAVPRAFMPGFVVAAILGAGFGAGLGFTLETSMKSPGTDIPGSMLAWLIIAVAGWGGTRIARRIFKRRERVA